MATHTINRAAIYARVSTTNHGQDVSMQTRELRDYCERRGWTVTGEYMDTGISGAKDRRPELDRLMADSGLDPHAPYRGLLGRWCVPR